MVPDEEMGLAVTEYANDRITEFPSDDEDNEELVNIAADRANRFEPIPTNQCMYCNEECSETAQLCKRCIREQGARYFT